MGIKASSFEDLKAIGVPLKELTKEKNNSFQDLPEAKNIATPLKELIGNGSFTELSNLNDGFEPIKVILSKKDDEKIDKKVDEKVNKKK